MYSKFQYVANDTSVVDFLPTAPDPNGWFALKEVAYTIDGRAVDRPKMEANGSWAVFNYYSLMHIECSGDLIANTSALFNVFKQTAVQKLMPAPESLQTDRTQGAIVMRMLGFSEDYSVPVVVETPFNAPAQGASPSLSPFRVVFKAFRPYFFGLSSSEYFWVG